MFLICLKIPVLIRSMAFITILIVQTLMCRMRSEDEIGFSSGEIITMSSDNPMGPFTLCGPILKNPQYYFGRGGNNHHCMFEFEATVVYWHTIQEF